MGWVCIGDEDRKGISLTYRAFTAPVILVEDSGKSDRGNDLLGGLAEFERELIPLLAPWTGRIAMNRSEHLDLI
jgi:hypothetical protein